MEKDPQEMSGRELAAVLAALRLAQEETNYKAFCKMPHFGDEVFKPLTPREINRLCERLNEVIPTRREARS